MTFQQLPACCSIMLGTNVTIPAQELVWDDEGYAKNLKAWQDRQDAKKLTPVPMPKASDYASQWQFEDALYSHRRGDPKPVRRQVYRAVPGSLEEQVVKGAQSIGANVPSIVTTVDRDKETYLGVVKGLLASGYRVLGTTLSTHGDGAIVTLWGKNLTAPEPEKRAVKRIMRKVGK